MRPAARQGALGKAIAIARNLRVRLKVMDRFRRFDEAYYHRFYESPQTRVVSPEEHANLASFVIGFARWNRLDLKSVLDIGAGIGLWKHWLEKHDKGIAYTGTEVSVAMCKKHGWLNRDIARWRDRKKHDLIICQGVLQYLPDPDVAPAVANIASMSRGLIYVEVTTRGDLRDRTDKARTDADIFVRNGSYYRGILAKHLISVGAGFWWAKDKPPPFYELEMAG
jgi:2-polyprenyl-3-methyl-5-hydroxy-6-metoxy-1,4-benzoquinol methylase